MFKTLAVLLAFLIFLNLLQSSFCTTVMESDTKIIPNQVYKAENLLECIGQDCEKINEFSIIDNFTVNNCLKNLPISYYLESTDKKVKVIRNSFIRPMEETDSKWELSHQQETLNVC